MTEEPPKTGQSQRVEILI